MLKQKHTTSTMLKMLIPVNSPRVPPIVAICWLIVVFCTLVDLIIVLVGVSTETVWWRKKFWNLLFNRIKMRNWYILSPMKIPKQQFYNFWVKFSICKYHTRRNFINFWLRKGGKKIWIFAGFPDYWLKTDSEEASEFRVYKKCSQD